MKNLLDLFDLRKMCWPAYFYFFTFILTYIITISYYKYYKKNLCGTQKILGEEELEYCIVNCTTFNYFYNFIHICIVTFIINLFCKYGSYIGTGIAIIMYLFSLIPLWYIIKLIMDKKSKQKDLKELKC